MRRFAFHATLLIFSAGAAHAQVSDDVVKIGVLTDLSGPAATATGPGSVTAAQMAAEDFGGKVLGKPITIISADHQIKPDIAAGIARQWYDVDKVDLIVDVPVSAVGLAVQQVANDRKKLFITHSTGTADFHGKFCSPYTMQWVFDTHALAVPHKRSSSVAATAGFSSLPIMLSATPWSAMLPKSSCRTAAR
jgi:branched-chain amino acid transport system substrate-binding protein